MFSTKIIRYAAVTLISQLVLIGLTMTLVELLGFSETLGYGLSLGLVYIFVYLSNSTFVFQVGVKGNTAARYALFIALFWILNTFVFSGLVVYASLHYIFAMLFNIVFLGLVRYYVQKKYVFVPPKR